jgi:hypothetical protein
MTIGADARLVSHVKHLPAHWATLYEITRLPDEEIERAIDDGKGIPEVVVKLLPERDALRDRGRSRTEPREATCS